MSINFNHIKGVKKEQLTLTQENFQGVFLNFTGKLGEYWGSIIPSLNISGYGDSEKEAVQDLEYNVEQFCNDLFFLDATNRILELKKLGWTKHQYFKKRYSPAFVDENGVLQNFDFPKEVKKTILEAA